ncbi:MAG: hypothetical protein GY940_36245 [bacterium]|nr:hypothetical protein [bacterium]
MSIIKKIIKKGEEAGSKVVDEGKKAGKAVFSNADRLVHDGANAAEQFGNYAKKHLEDIEPETLQFVRDALKELEDIDDIMLTAHATEKLLKHGFQQIHDSIKDFPEIVEKGVLGFIRNNPLIEKGEKSLKEVEDKLNEIRHKVENSTPDLDSAGGKLMAKLSRSMNAILTEPLKEVERLTRKLNINLPGESEFEFLVKEAKSFEGMINKDHPTEIDLEKFNGLISQLASKAEEGVAKIAGPAAKVTSFAVKEIGNLLTMPVEISGLSELYGFLTATRSNPKGNPLSLGGALSFAGAAYAVPQFKVLCGKSPFTPGQAEILARMDFNAQVSLSQMTTVIMKADPNGNPGHVNTSNETADQEHLDTLYLWGLMAGLLDLNAQAMAAVINASLGRDNVSIGIGGFLSLYALATTWFAGPGLHSYKSWPTIEKLITSGEKPGLEELYDLVMLTSEWLSTITAFIILIIRVFLGKVSKFVVPFIISALGVVEVVGGLAYYYLRQAHTAVGLASKSVSVVDSAVIAGDAILEYLQYLFAVAPDVLEFLKSQITNSAAEGVTTPIEMVVERALPAAMWAIYLVRVGVAGGLFMFDKKDGFRFWREA